MKVSFIAVAMALVAMSGSAFAGGGGGFGADSMLTIHENHDIPPCFTITDPDKVIRNCTKYLTADPLEERARIVPKIATAYLQLGQFANAIGILDAAVEQLPANQDVLTLRCWTRAVLHQNLDGALADCNTALEMYSEPATLDARGLVYFRMGHYGAAIDDLNTALKKSPKLVTSLYVRGLAKLKSNDVEGGNADIAAAKAIDPQIAEQLAGYGVTP